MHNFLKALTFHWAYYTLISAQLRGLKPSGQLTFDLCAQYEDDDWMWVVYTF